MSLTGSEHVICICTLYMRYEYNMYIIYIIYEVWIYYVYIYIYMRVYALHLQPKRPLFGVDHVTSRGHWSVDSAGASNPLFSTSAQVGSRVRPWCATIVSGWSDVFPCHHWSSLVQVFPSPKSFQSRASSWPLIWLCEQIVMGNLKIRFIMNGNSILRIGSDIE